MRRLARHARILPSPLVSPYYYNIHNPTPSYHPAPGNLERRHRVSRAAPIFDIIPQHLATHRKHPIDMRTNQRDHFCTRQCGRVPDLVVLWYCLSRSIHSPTSGDSQFTAATTSSRTNTGSSSRVPTASSASRRLTLRRTCIGKLSRVVHSNKSDHITD